MWLWWVVVSVVASMPTSRAQEDPSLFTAKEVTEPASIACNATYSLPCARTNAEYLARTVARKLVESTTVDVLLQEINDGRHNLDEGFYPFVVNRDTGEYVAHGADPSERCLQPVAFVNATALHERFLAADKRMDTVLVQ